MNLRNPEPWPCETGEMVLRSKEPAWLETEREKSHIQSMAFLRQETGERWAYPSRRRVWQRSGGDDRVK